MTDAAPFRWQVGVTTAPRERPTLTQTLRSLAAAGFELPHLFAEPESPIDAEAESLCGVMTRRSHTLGAWSNWLLALTELYLIEPRADAYLICQDDLLLSRGARRYLEASLWPAPDAGTVSLYCPSHHATGKPDGWHAEDRGASTWGALALAFPNPSLRAFLSDPLCVNHRHHGPRRGRANIDSLVGAWCRSAERGYFVHVPSLAQHTGETSTLWPHATATGRRRADRFASDASLIDAN